MHGLDLVVASRPMPPPSLLIASYWRLLITTYVISGKVKAGEPSSPSRSGGMFMVVNSKWHHGRGMYEFQQQQNLTDN